MLFFFVARVLFGALIIAAVFSIGFYAFRFVKQLFQKGMHTAKVWENDSWTKIDRLDADLYQDIRSTPYSHAKRTTIEIH